MSYAVRCHACREVFTASRIDASKCSARCRKRWSRASPSERLAMRYGIEIRDLWRTPPDVFAAADARWGFGLDASATAADALCPRFIGPDEDSRTVEWAPRCLPNTRGERWAWLNPPYSKAAGSLLQWVEVAISQAEPGLLGVVMLIPPSFATRYMALCMARGRAVEVFPRRLSFVDPATGQPVRGNRGDSCLVEIAPGAQGPAVVRYL